MKRGRESATDSADAPGFDDALAALADPQRRHIVRLLREEGSLPVSRLVAALADRREGEPDESAVWTHIEETHLPELADVGLLTVDEDADKVHVGTLTPAVLTVLDVDPDGQAVDVLDQASNVPPGDDGELRSPTKRLVEQKRMFSTLVANLPGMVYRCENEPDWPMSFVSEGCRDLTGYDPGDLEDDRVNWGEDIIHPGDTDRLWEAVQEAVQDHEPFAVTYRIVRADGTERVVWEQGRAIYEGGEVEALEGFITDITEQRRRERRLEAVFDGTFQFMGLLEPDGTVLEVNAAALEFGGIERDDAVGDHVWETTWWQIDDQTRREVREAVEGAAAGEFVRYEVTVQGEERTATVDFSLRPVTDDAGEVTLLVAEGRDITERVRREEQLASLHEVSARLVEAERPTDACEVAIDAAQETLGLELAAVYLFDEGQGNLEPTARTDPLTAIAGDRPLFGTDDELLWEAFVDQEQTVAADVATDAGISAADTPLGSAIVLPLGTHGVFVVGATEADAFDETDRTLAETLATHLEVSLDSLHRELELRERSESLAEKNERMAQLNALNDAIRDLLRSLIGASNRQEILRTACESLAAVGPYRLAWIGRLDPADDAVVVDARAGVADGYLDTVTSGGEGTDAEPAVRALRTEEVVVVDQTRADPPFEPWRKAALDRDYGSVLAIPLTYEDARHGVLAVYASESSQFDDLEQSVLTELAGAVSYAITAAQRKQALLTEQVVELELGLHDPDTPLLRSVRAAGGEFTLDGAFQRDEGTLRVFFSFSGDTDALEAACDTEPDIGDLRVVADGEEGTRYECVMLGRGLLSTVVDHGGLPRELRVEDEVTLVVELPADRDVREFTETVAERFPSASVLAHRQRDRPLQTASGFRQQLEDRLTERNLEVVTQAYYSGFFEWPRENSGADVADALDISQPTFNRHIRNAQQVLFELLVDDTDGDD